MVLNIKGRLTEFARPAVMGIVNVTPDSFYEGSRTGVGQVTDRVARMLDEGADIIDLGGYSTRPGAAEVSAADELGRLLPAVDEIRRRFPDIPLSVDTYRAAVAAECLAHGADIVNDIGGGDLDTEMFETVAEARAPYILMHMRGTPATMQTMTDYEDVAADVLRDLAFKTDRLHQLGVCDVIIDPGFGFAKTTEQNYRMLAELRQFELLGRPLLAGMSRKSMITKVLGCDSGSGAALAATTALNVLALERGASILRVHDVEAASAAVEMFVKMENARHSEHT